MSVEELHVGFLSLRGIEGERGDTADGVLGKWSGDR